ncbi:hypothetical protein X975_17573, partial [Stegodyphus mimosarum]
MSDVYSEPHPISNGLSGEDICLITVIPFAVLSETQS